MTVIGNSPFQQTFIGNFPSELKLTVNLTLNIDIKISSQGKLQKIEILLTQRFKQLQLRENDQSAVL